MPRHFRVAVAVALFGASIVVEAQRPTDVVKWSAAPDAISVKPGSSANVALTARMQAGWHLYALTQPKGGPNPLKIAIAEGVPLTIPAAGIQAPPPQVITDPNFELETRQYDGAVTFTVPVGAAKDARAGTHETTIDITFQACGNGICLRPYTQKLPLRITIAAPAAR
jgi:hypothetical protein